MTFGWKMRIGVVLSAVWFCLVFLTADDYQRAGHILGFGFLPLVITWGIAWAVAGWRAQRPTKAPLPEATLLEAKRQRRHRIRTFFAVAMILAIGLFLATWQFHVVDNEAGGQEIGYWFGQWLVYGIIVYLVLSFPFRKFPGIAVVLTAIVVVGAVNYKAYAAISEDRLAIVSLAKAAPLLNKIQSGASVSDRDVMDAKVGMMEPLLLAQAAYSREVVAITATYTKGIAALQPELMLTPNSLVSPSIRLQTRANLKLWSRSAPDFRSQFNLAVARGKLAMQAAELLMPTSMANSASKGFDKTSAEQRAYIDKLVNSEQEAIDTIKDVLDLMDARLGSYSIESGPPVKLLFQDEATLARYRQLMDAVEAVGQREAEAQNGLLKLQSDNTDKLTNLLQR